MNWLALVVLAGVATPEGAMTTGVSLSGRGETQSASMVAHGRLQVGFEVSKFFVQARGSLLLSGANEVTAQDLGSSLTIGVRPSEIVRRVSLEFIPFNSVNRRAFFDWDNRVGTFETNRAVPALTLELELQRVTAWVTGRIATLNEPEVTRIAAPVQPSPDVLAGVDVTIVDGLTFGVRGAWLQSALINPYQRRPQFVASGRIEYTFGHAIAPFADFVNYGNDPQRFERLFVTPQEGNAAQISFEGGYLGSTTGRPTTLDFVGTETARHDGWFDLQARAQLGDFRLSATGRLQTWEIMSSPTSPQLSAATSGVHQPRLLGLFGASWTARKLNLTPAILFGMSRQATFDADAVGGSNPPPSILESRLLSDRDGLRVVDSGSGLRPKFHVGGSLTWQPVDQFVLITALDVVTQGGLGFPQWAAETVIRGQVLAQFRF